MAKRKIDCKMDDIIMEYLKKVKCEKSSKMFGTESSTGSDHSESLIVSPFRRKWQNAK